jgi:hypothetical protein
MHDQRLGLYTFHGYNRIPVRFLGSLYDVRKSENEPSAVALYTIDGSPHQPNLSALQALD